MLIKALKWFGYIWIYTAGTLIAIGYVWTLIKQGWWAFADLFNPFNLTNFLLVMLFLMPGLLAVYWADKLAERRREASREKR